MILLSVYHTTQKVPDLDGLCLKYILDGIVRGGYIEGLGDDDYRNLMWDHEWPIIFRRVTGRPGWTCLKFSGQEFPLVAPAPTWNRVLQVSANKRALSALKAKCRDLVMVSSHVHKHGEVPREVPMSGYARPCNYGTFLLRYYRQVLGRKAWPSYMADLVERGGIPWAPNQ